MTTLKNLWKTLSAKRNTGRKPKLCERDRRILKGIASKNHRTAAAKLTAEINIHPEDRVHKNSSTVASLIHDRPAIAKPLITENNAKSEKMV